MWGLFGGAVFALTAKSSRTVMDHCLGSNMGVRKGATITTKSHCHILHTNSSLLSNPRRLSHCSLVFWSHATPYLCTVCLMVFWPPRKNTLIKSGLLGMHLSHSTQWRGICWWFQRSPGYPEFHKAVKHTTMVKRKHRKQKTVLSLIHINCVNEEAGQGKIPLKLVVWSGWLLKNTHFPYFESKVI